MKDKAFFLTIFSIIIGSLLFLLYFGTSHASDWTYFGQDRIIYHSQHLGANGHITNWIEYPTYTYIYLYKNNSTQVAYNLLFPERLDFSGQSSVSFAIALDIAPVTVSASTNCRVGFHVAYRANLSTFPSHVNTYDWNFTTATTSYTTVYLKKTRSSNLTANQQLYLNFTNIDSSGVRTCAYNIKNLYYWDTVSNATTSIKLDYASADPSTGSNFVQLYDNMLDMNSVTGQTCVTDGATTTCSYDLSATTSVIQVTSGDILLFLSFIIAFISMIFAGFVIKTFVYDRVK